MLLFIAVIGLILGMLGVFCFKYEGKNVINGAPTYASHQVRIYPRLIPIGPFLLIMTMAMAAHDKERIVFLVSIMSLFLIIILLIITAHSLREGRKKIEKIEKGIVVRAANNFKAIKYDLSQKSYSGNVILNEKMYKAYQVTEHNNIILEGDEAVVEGTDNYHLVVKPKGEKNV